MKWRHILFDLDGTLVDSRLGIFNCFKHAFRVMGRPVPSDEELFFIIGPPLDQSFRVRFHMSEEETRFALKTYRERYSTLGVFECTPIAGAKELLAWLRERGYTVLLATSKPEPYAKMILDRLGWTKYFHFVCGSDFEVTLKTKADVVNEAIRRGGLEREACVIIGDRKYDVEGGKLCGIHTLGVKVGFAAEGELEASGAEFVAENFSEVHQILEKNGK